MISAHSISRRSGIKSSLSIQDRLSLIYRTAPPPHQLRFKFKLGILFCAQCLLMHTIIHCNIFSYSDRSRAHMNYIFLISTHIQAKHRQNKSRICHVLTPSETNTRFTCMPKPRPRIFSLVPSRMDFKSVQEC